MWSFEAIADAEPERTTRLQQGPSWERLCHQVVERLSESLLSNTVKFAREQSSEDQSWLRTVVQFWVGEDLLDWFFNSHSGYRAQFRQDWRRGLRENELLLAHLRSALSKLPNKPIACRTLSPSLKDLGEAMAAPIELTSSLEPSLSKIWSCRDIMDGNGEFRQVSLGLTTPKLGMPDGSFWLAISQQDQDAYLEIKGAFSRPQGLYQPKAAELRAKAIQTAGEPGSK